MKALGLAVGLFAVVAGLAGRQTGDDVLYMLAVASLICAATTWLSGRYFPLSENLRGDLFGQNDHLRAGRSGRQARPVSKSLKEYSPTDKLPLTVAIFSILVYAVSKFAIMREMTRIADLYFAQNERGSARIWPFNAFRAPERRIAVAMIVTLVVINQAQVGIMLACPFSTATGSTPFRARIPASFWRLLLWVFLPWAFIYVASAVMEFVLQSMLVIRWRKWLTQHYIGEWLGGHAHYRIIWRAARPTTPTSASRRMSPVSSTAARTAMASIPYSILLIYALVARFVFHPVMGPVGQLRLPRHRCRHSGLPVLGGAGLCGDRHADHPFDRPLAGWHLLRAPEGGGRFPLLARAPS